MAAPPRVVERVLRRIQTAPNGCIVSTYSVGSHGYAQVGWHEAGKRRMTLCHRIAYEVAHGPIPEGMTVDHLCHNRRCVNPAHLRLLTRQENGRLTARFWRTHCSEGHPFSGTNLVVRRDGSRGCRECMNRSSWMAYRRRKAG